MPGKIVFLDRDGTINVDKDYAYRIEDFELIGGAAEGLKLLTQNSYRLVIISNQSGVGHVYSASISAIDWKPASGCEMISL